jgi:DNA replication licensing factor MCM3
VFRTKLQDEEQIFLTDLIPMINEGLPIDEVFSTAEANEACQMMQNSEELMISEGIVYKI